jgi:uncharacterized protein YbaA (DUF1428 family)
MKKNFGIARVFLIPVPRSKLGQYKKLMKIITKIWMDHGALSYCECIGEGLEKGKITSFPRSLKLKKGEVVILGWSTFKNKPHFERVMKKVMMDPRLAPFMDPKKLGFDAMRMYWGGFKPMIQA